MIRFLYVLLLPIELTSFLKTNPKPPVSLKYAVIILYLAMAVKLKNRVAV